MDVKAVLAAAGMVIAMAPGVVADDPHPDPIDLEGVAACVGQAVAALLEHPGVEQILAFSACAQGPAIICLGGDPWSKAGTNPNTVLTNLGRGTAVVPIRVYVVGLEVYELPLRVAIGGVFADCQGTGLLAGGNGGDPEMGCSSWTWVVPEAPNLPCISRWLTAMPPR